jgi:hypothetical protein
MFGEHTILMLYTETNDLTPAPAPHGIISAEPHKLKLERTWAMPKRDILRIAPVNKFLIEEMGAGYWLTDLFTDAGNMVDRHVMDILSYYKPESMDGVIFNAPTTFAQVAAYQKRHGVKWDGRASWWSVLKGEVNRIVVPGGRVICVSWDSNGMGMSRGYCMDRILMVSHGSHWHDSIVTSETKVRPMPKVAASEELTNF